MKKVMPCLPMHAHVHKNIIVTFQNQISQIGSLVKYAKVFYLENFLVYDNIIIYTWLVKIQYYRAIYRLGCYENRCTWPVQVIIICARMQYSCKAYKDEHNGGCKLISYFYVCSVCVYLHNIIIYTDAGYDMTHTLYGQ